MILQKKRQQFIEPTMGFFHERHNLLCYIRAMYQYIERIMASRFWLGNITMAIDLTQFNQYCIFNMINKRQLNSVKSNDGCNIILDPSKTVIFAIKRITSSDVGLDASWNFCLWYQQTNALK